MEISDYYGKDLDPNRFEVPGQGKSGSVDEFLSVADREKWKTITEYFPPKAEPIALCSGGGMLLHSDNEDKRVFYWDHEDPHNPIFLADDLTSFMAMIEWNPPDDDDHDYVVISKWIDPDFRLELEDDESPES